MAWRMRRRLFTITGIILLSGTSLGAEEIRTWTAKAGGFTVEAKFLSLDGGQVMLERADGKKIKVPLNKLSDADQKYVENAGSENPFKLEGDTPAATGDGPRTVEVDWSNVRMVPLVPQNATWSLALGPIPPPAVAKPPAAIPLPPKTDFFEGTRGLLISDTAGVAAIGYLLTRPGENESKTRLILCSFAERGKVIAQATFPVSMVPVCISGDGKSVVMRVEEFGKQPDRLEIWEITAPEIRRVAQWTPYGDLMGGERDVKWAEFVGPSNLLTLSGAGKLVLWNLSNFQPEYTLTIQGGISPAVSPDGKYAVFINGEDMGVLDIAAGEVLASQRAPKTFFPVLRFSPTGKQFACAGSDKLFVYDTANGQTTQEILLTAVQPGGQLLWTSEKHLLFGGHYLLDISTQVPLWEYQGHEFASADRGPCAFVVSEGDSKPGVLITASLPQAGVEQTLATAMKDPSFFVLKPGTTVRLNLDALPDPQEREKARASLTQKLQELGMQVGTNGSTIDLVATTDVAQPDQRTYQTFGFGFGQQTVTVRDHFVVLRFMYQGKAAWESRSGGVPGFINLQEGETIDQVVKKFERFNYEHFQQVQLPKLLIKPTGRATLGLSQVSVAGIR